MIPLFDEIFETGGSIEAVSTLYFAMGEMRIPINIENVKFWINISDKEFIMNPNFRHIHSYISNYLDKR